MRPRLDIGRCNCCLQTTELCCSRLANARQIFSASYLFLLHALDSAVSFQQHGQLVLNARVLSYAPQCSGDEQTVSSCTSTQPTSQCSQIALVSCRNATTSTTSQAVAIPSSSSSSTPLSPSSAYLAAHPTLVLSKTLPTPNSTAPPLVTPQSTADPVPTTQPSSSQLLPTATTSHHPPPPSPSLSPLNTNKATDKEIMSPFLFYTLIGSGVLVVVAIALSLLAAVLSCRRYCSRGRKGPVVEDHTYDLPISSRNHTYIELENQKSPLPQTEERFYADPTTPSAKHTLKHSPETPTRKSMPNAHGSRVVPNEVLYEHVHSKRKEQQRSQEPQKPPFYHEVQSPTTTKPFYHTLDDSASNRMGHKYHVLEAPPGIQQQVQGTGEPIYSQACERRAATFPRQATRTRGTIEPVAPARGQPVEEML